MDAGREANLFPCALAAILLVIVPWDYVWRNFVAAKSDRRW
jgi:hypothetical protein